MLQRVFFNALFCRKWWKFFVPFFNTEIIICNTCSASHFKLLISDVSSPLSITIYANNYEICIFFLQKEKPTANSWQNISSQKLHHELVSTVIFHIFFFCCYIQHLWIFKQFWRNMFYNSVKLTVFWHKSYSNIKILLKCLILVKAICALQ